MLSFLRRLAPLTDAPGGARWCGVRSLGRRVPARRPRTRRGSVVFAHARLLGRVGRVGGAGGQRKGEEAGQHGARPRRVSLSGRWYRLSRLMYSSKNPSSSDRSTRIEPRENSKASAHGPSSSRSSWKRANCSSSAAKSSRCIASITGRISSLCSLRRGKRRSIGRARHHRSFPRASSGTSSMKPCLAICRRW